MKSRGCYVRETNGASDLLSMKAQSRLRQMMPPVLGNSQLPFQDGEVFTKPGLPQFQRQQNYTIDCPAVVAGSLQNLNFCYGLWRPSKMSRIRSSSSEGLPARRSRSARFRSLASLLAARRSSRVAYSSSQLCSTATLRL